MASATYDSSNYDSAKAKYDELASKYAGKGGIEFGNAQGSVTASTAGQNAAKAASSAARSAGLSKSQSALGGMGKASDAASSNFATGVSQANTAATNALTAGQNTLAGAQAKDDQRFKQSQANANSINSGIASGASALASIIGAVIAASDKDLKHLDGGSDNVKDFAKIHSYKYTYTDDANSKAADKPAEYPGVDDKVHEGVIAQDIEKAVPSAVVKNADGYRVINENELTNATAATVGELSRRVITLENILKARGDKVNG